MAKSNKTIIKPLMGVFKTGQWNSIPDTSITKNGISEIILRGWQSEILDLRKESKSPHLFINCPTGSGKSKAALAIVIHADKNTDKLVIISAPQKEIGKGFLSSSGIPERILDHTWLINPANQLCENSYRNEDGNIARLLEFIKTPRLNDLNERTLVCCHATLALLFDKLSAYDKKKYLKNIKLCIDESHHSFSQEETGNGLGKVVNYFLSHSDKELDLVMMTATPFRGDGGSLTPEKYSHQFCRYDLDYGRHFEENCDGLEFTYNAVLTDGDPYGTAVKQLLNKYLDCGDRVMVQIPTSNRSISNGKFNDLQKVYDTIGKNQTVDSHGVVCIKRGKSIVRVLDLVTEKNRDHRLDYLRDNMQKKIDNIDVVIGISIIKEGFDWPPANAGILIGSQGSLNAQIQLMGRMFRAYKNKGKDNGKKPVEISQIFPFIDHEKLEEDKTREQINTFMKVVYSALAMELVIDPIHIDLPIKTDKTGKALPRQSVKNYLLEHLSDTKCADLITSIMDDYRDWKATAGDDVNVTGKISEIVCGKLTELGINENHVEICQFFNKSLQRSAKFQLMAMEGIDVSHIDINLMDDILDPIESIIMGMTNGICGAATLREFQELIKPVDTLRRCYELKEWVKKNGRWPKQNSTDSNERSLAAFITNITYAKRGKGTMKISETHIYVLESIEGWNWSASLDEEWIGRFEILRNLGKMPQSKSVLYSWTRTQKMFYKDGTISKERVESLESLSFWIWDIGGRWISYIDKLEKMGMMPPKNHELYKWIVTQKTSYKNRGLSDKRIRMLESLSFWSWSDREKITDNTLKRAREVASFFTRYKIPPKSHSQDPKEKSLGYFYISRKNAKKGSGKGLITSEEDQIYIKAGLPDWTK